MELLANTQPQADRPAAQKRQRAVKLPDQGRVTVRLEPELRADLQGFARAQGIGMAEAVRRVLQGSRGQLQSAIAGHARREQQRRYLVLTEPSLIALGELTEALETARLSWGRVGTNANQIAARANTGSSPLARDVEQLRAEVAEVRWGLEDMGTLVMALMHNPDALYRAAEAGEVAPPWQS